MRTRGIRKSLIGTSVRIVLHLYHPRNRSTGLIGENSTRMMIPLPPVLETIVAQLAQGGFRALVVGGAVRDTLLGHAAKDIDIEVYGITYDRLAEILSSHGRVDVVGTSFGVIKFTLPGGDTYDFSLPRRDSKTGRSHRDFLSTFDPSISPRQA